jgi:hypothetical protein
MGILGHVWDVATSFMPFGGIVNKLGRAGADLIRNNRDKVVGIAGKVAGEIGRNILPEHVRNAVSTIADKAIDLVPEGKVKETLKELNDTAQDRNNNYTKSNVTINPASDVYGVGTINKPVKEKTATNPVRKKNKAPSVFKVPKRLRAY